MICAECRNTVNDQARACPFCTRPIKYYGSDRVSLGGMLVFIFIAGSIAKAIEWLLMK